MIIQTVVPSPVIDGDQDCEDDEELNKRSVNTLHIGVDDDESDDAVED